MSVVNPAWCWDKDMLQWAETGLMNAEMISLLLQGAVPHWQDAIRMLCAIHHPRAPKTALEQVQHAVKFAAIFQPQLQCNQLCVTALRRAAVCTLASSSHWNCHTAKGRLVPQWLHPRPLKSLFFSAQSPIVKKRMALSNTRQDGMRWTAGADCCLDSVGEQFLGSSPSRALPPEWDHSALSSPTRPRSKISALIAKPIPAFFRAGRAVAGHKNRHAKKALYI